MLFTFFNFNFMQLAFQLLVSESIFLIGREKKRQFLPRIIGAVLLVFILCFCWQQVVEAMSGEALIWNVPLYFGYAILAVLPMLLCFEITPLEFVFTLAGTYATQHMTFTIGKIILYVIHVPYATYGNLVHLIITRYLIFIIGAVVVYFLIIRANKGKNGFEKGDIRIAVLAIVVLLAAIGLSVYWSYPEEYSGTSMGEIICPAYSFLCCALVLVMEYYVLRENSMKHEQEVMEQLLQMADSQQKSAQEAIDIINIKCHDLKHQIKSLAKMEDAQSRSEYLEEVQSAVSIYDATYHTGSKALDYILREKSLLFDERNVEFSCMIEGQTLEFMSAADIYALMGNALDNALEQVLKEAEDERVISLDIRSHEEMLLIHLENRCSDAPEFKDGLPITTKQDKSQHGFGVKSMRYITEKYHGTLFMGMEDGKFYLDMLFPLEENN